MFPVGLPAEVWQPVFWKWSLDTGLDSRHTVCINVDSSSFKVDISLA